MRTLEGIITATAVAVMLVTGGIASSDAAPKRGSYPATNTVSKPVSARTRAFDGIWSVSIVTRAGPCDPNYRYPARIFGTRVLQADNDFSYQITGAVNGRGAIKVTVSKGGQSATGYGRLAGSRGGGSWSAAGGMCSGVWSASRRL